jgi:hypothetical protein
LTDLLAGLAANSIGSFVKGFTPQRASVAGLLTTDILAKPATIQRTSGEVRFVLFRKWDRRYSIASAARTELPRVRLTPRGCSLTLNRQRSGSLFRAFACARRSEGSERGCLPNAKSPAAF